MVPAQYLKGRQHGRLQRTAVQDGDHWAHTEPAPPHLGMFRKTMHWGFRS